MIIVSWQNRTAPDKAGEGIEWVKKVIAKSKNWGASSKAWILRPRTGSFNRFTLAVQFASLAEYEESTARRNADPGFQALLKERQESDWFVDLETTINEVIVETTR